MFRFCSLHTNIGCSSVFIELTGHPQYIYRMMKEKTWLDMGWIIVVIFVSALLVRDNVLIVEYFIDHYKYVGAYFGTDAHFLPLFLLLGIIKLSYFFLIVFRVMPWKTHTIRLISGLVALTCIFMLLEWGIMHLVYDWLRNTPGLRIEWHYSLKESVERFILVGVAGVFIYFARMGLHNFRQLKIIFNNQMALQQIRAQNEPHFLFNTLNSLYAMSIEQEADQMASAIEKLTANLRFVYQNRNKPLVPLSEEIENIGHYIDLQRIRIDQDKVDITFNRADGDRITRINIPPLTLMNYAENAFKHGVSYKQSSFVRFQVSEQADGVLICVENSVHTKPGSLGEGIKLSERLLAANLDRKKYELNVGHDDRLFRVSLFLRYDTSHRH